MGLFSSESAKNLIDGRRRLVALGAALVLFMGTTMQSCAFLDLLTGLYTGTYIEYSACPLANGGGCEIYDVVEETEQWKDCVACAVDTAFPPDDFVGPAAEKTVDQAVELFWTENNDRVMRALGNSVTEIADFTPYPMGLALDPGNGHVYWSDWRADGIRRANLDGSNVQTVATGLSVGAGLALDTTSQVLYWSDPGRGVIQQIALGSGTPPTDLVTGLQGPIHLALDGAGTLYWIENTPSGGSIQRANLDGSAVEAVVTGLTAPAGLAIDAGAGKVYWTDMLDGALRRANLDGTVPEDVLTGLAEPGGVAVDAAAGKVYWVDVGSIQIRRANLDGSGAETLIAGQPTADLAVDPSGGRLYGTGWLSRTLWRANLDGSARQPIVAPQGISGDVAVDPMSAKIYWVVTSTGTIQRANFDGSDVEAVTGVEIGLQAVAFDPANAKLYWTANGTVRRADPDGANAETILTGITFIGDLEIDPVAGKLYWISRQSIGRANLDGTQPETFFTDTGFPAHLALDGDTRDLFWSVPAMGVVRHASLDGGPVTDIVTNRSARILDVTSSHLYWTLPSANKVQRASRDGTGIEDVLINRVSVSGLTLLEAAPIPVELTRFHALADGRDVQLAWMTASETNNAGFEVQQAAGDGWAPLGFVPGAGTTTAPQTYRYRVKEMPPGTHRFRLKQIDVDGRFEYSPVVEVDVRGASGFALEGNFPNPFAATTQIRYTLPGAAHVRLSVVDLLGREVARLVDERQEAGAHIVPFDAQRLASGTYLYRIQAGTHQASRRMVLVR